MRTPSAALAIGTACSALIALGACQRDATRAPDTTSVVQAVDFELVPLERTCPATTPVTFNGVAGIPATYAVVYHVTIVNGTSKPITVEQIGSRGYVLDAVSQPELGHSAHVFNTLAFVSPGSISPGDQVAVTGSMSVLCGDNPHITQPSFWDIATTLSIVTSGGDADTIIETFRRSWDRCDSGHPCPATQPPLPSN